MGEFVIVVGLLALLAFGGMYIYNQQVTMRGQALEDAKAEARRWVERLGGQVLNLSGTDAASQQAIADASERYTAAGSQLEQAQTVKQARLVTDTALEGLYYVRAARTAMGMDPGPELPDAAERARAGRVTEERDVDVEGHRYAASPEPGEQTPHYYPGGRVAGRQVPEGWYSEPWWRPALRAGAWGMGSVLLFNAMFAGMVGVPSAQAWEAGHGAGEADAGGGDGAGEAGGEAGGDFGGAEASGDFGGDVGGGGFDFGDFGF